MDDLTKPIQHIAGLSAIGSGDAGHAYRVGVYPLQEVFGRKGIRSIILRLRHQSPDGRDYSVVLDGQEFDLYEEAPGPQGRPVLRQAFDRRQLFPEPYYLGAKLDLRMTFEARFYDVAEPDRIIFHPDLVPTEELLLRVAGLHAQTRPLQGRGVDEPWPAPPYKSILTIDDIGQRLREVSTRISESLGHKHRLCIGVRKVHITGAPGSAMMVHWALNAA